MSGALKYRPEIDGLRALAVLPVVFYHAGFPLFRGGYVGVDIFFVISGYLITTIIYREISNGGFSIVRFYERRIRRIIPALVLVCASCIPFAWLWMGTQELKEFAQSLIAVNLFSSNVLFWMETDYFAQAAELKPLLHTWSLAVEEQFYVFFPLILLFLARLRRSALLATLAGLSVLSFGICLWLVNVYYTANFYLPPSRAWELGVGGILAISGYAERDQPRWLANALAATGLALILYSVFALDDATPFPSSWALLPVGGTALILAAASRQTIVGRLLSLAPLTFVGLISYSLYLWHQPLFAFARLRLLNEPTPEVYVLLSAASVVLAYLSWRYVERPFRTKGLLTRKHVYSTAGVCCSLIAMVGVVGHVEAGFPGRMSPAYAQMARWSQDRSSNSDQCTLKILDDHDPDDWCEYKAGRQDKGSVVAVWGDSHGDALAYFLAPRFNDIGYGLKPLTALGCASVLDVSRPGYGTDCYAFNKTVADFLRSDAAPKVVLLASRWTILFEGDGFDNQEGGKEHHEFVHLLPTGNGAANYNEAQRADTMGKLLRDTIQTLIHSGKKVVLIYPIPEVGWDVPQYLEKELRLGLPLSPPLSTSYDVYEKRTQNVRAQLDAIPDNENLIRFRPAQVLCNNAIPGRCVAQQGDKPLYVDDDHPSRFGAELLGESLFAKLEKRGWIEAAPRSDVALDAGRRASPEAKH